jgi:hypothetical protein
MIDIADLRAAIIEMIETIGSAAGGTPVSPPAVCSLCLGTGKVFHENPPRKDTPYSRCHCTVVSRPSRGGDA